MSAETQSNGTAAPPSMETIAAQRRETLLALRKRKEDEEAGRVQPGTGVQEIQALVEQCFRSFDPSTRRMRRPAVAEGITDTVEQAVDGLQATVLAEDEIKRGEDIDLLNIAPQRPNWDLKRNLNKRLAKLTRRDQEAINTLIRRRITSQNPSATTADTALAHLAAEDEVDRRRTQGQPTPDQDEDQEDY